MRLDGQPIGQVMVVFVPEDKQLPQSLGVTDDQGHFKLRRNNGRAVAAVGESRGHSSMRAMAAVPKGGALKLPTRARFPPAASRRSIIVPRKRRCGRQSPPVR